MPLGFTRVLSKQMSAAFVLSFALFCFKPAYYIGSPGAGEACLPHDRVHGQLPEHAALTESAVL